MKNAEQNSIITALWQEFVSNLATILSQSELTANNTIASAITGQRYADQNCDGLLTLDASLRLTVVNGTRLPRYLIAGCITGIIEKSQQNDREKAEKQNLNS